MDIEKGISSTKTLSITTDVYTMNSSNNDNSQPESTNSKEIINICVNDDITENHLENLTNESITKKNEEIIDNGIMVEKKNVNNSNMINGWVKSTDDLYYYYENGNRIKELDRVRDNKWRERELNNTSIYEVGEYDSDLKRNGLFRKYINDTICEESIYKDDKFLRKCKLFNGGKVNEYDENGYLVYVGKFTIDENGEFRKSKNEIKDEYIYYNYSHESFFSVLYKDNEISGIGWILSLILIGIYDFGVGWYSYCWKHISYEDFYVYFNLSISQFALAIESHMNYRDDCGKLSMGSSFFFIFFSISVSLDYSGISFICIIMI